MQHKLHPDQDCSRSGAGMAWVGMGL